MSADPSSILVAIAPQDKAIDVANPKHVENVTETVVIESAEACTYDLAQHSEDWKHAIRANPKAIAWCCYSLFTCVMWGYDGLASAIVLAIPWFRQDYGVEYMGSFIIPAKWQLAFTGASLIGLVIGGVTTGFAAKRWGRQLCMFAAYVLTVGGVFLQWFSSGNLPMFFGGKLLTGIPLGVFVTVAPTYCSEIAPLALRGMVTGAVNFAIVLGQLLGYGVMRQTQNIQTSRSYQILFAVQWGFAAVALTILPFFPESPYFLVAKGQIEKARKNIIRLHGQEFDTDGFLATIQAGLDAEKDGERAGFVECFQGTNLKRTLIAVSTFFVQACSGTSWVLGYMSYFMELAGMSDANAFNTSVGLTGLMLIGNVIGWFLVEKAGRRNTIVFGCVVLAATLLLIGIMGVVPVKNAIWAQVAFMAVWSVTYQATIGTAAWAVIAEVPTSALRGHTQSLSTAMTGIMGAVWSFAMPYMVNPDEANLGGKIGFIFGGILAVCCVGMYFYYPETKGRTFVEIDTLFRMGVPMRKFHTVTLSIEADIMEKSDEL